MKILHICSIDNDKASGVSVIVPQYALSQVKENDVYLYNVNKVRCKEIQGVQVYHDWDKVNDVINCINIEIAVFHGIYFIDYIAIYKRLMKQGIPYVIVPHGSLTKRAQSLKKIPKVILNASFFKKFINNARLIQYLSNAEKQESKAFAHPDVIIPNGVFLKEKSWKRKSKETFDFLYIGRYSVYLKGIDLMIDACAKIQDEMRKHQIRLHLYGVDVENNLLEIKKRVKENKINDIVLINGPVYDKEKEHIMLEADCFIQTSRSEGQPVGVLEAMSLGLVTVLTEGTTLARLVEEEKCGYNAGNTLDSIAETILRAYDERESAEEMSKRALALVKNTFSWDIVAHNTKKIYEQEIKKRGDFA